ncbi:PASTA sensor-containing serine/threonine protein kinase [Nitzschia inconspicua]|uniref:PASTA sensor-containing serine/threonine protein kinase n=1 Tax=Nitzschia inconspicua TaxID=303405 RepID=A0A9K3KI31_9STRA|nr:PASTA sensor-containing serine/threonine protein kinase [Nitzschia inconspicua]
MSKAKNRGGMSQSSSRRSVVLLDIQEGSIVNTDSLSSSTNDVSDPPKQEQLQRVIDQKALSVQTMLDALERGGDCKNSNIIDNNNEGDPSASSDTSIEFMELLPPAPSKSQRQFVSLNGNTTSSNQNRKMTTHGHSSDSQLHFPIRRVMRRRRSEDLTPVLDSTSLQDISPSETVHFRPRLEIAMEQQREIEEVNRRRVSAILRQQQRLSASCVMDGTLHESKLSISLDDSFLSITNENLALEGLSDDPYQTACQVAKSIHEEDFEHSKIDDLCFKIPQFDFDEIQLGLFLGKGSFAQVIEVRGFALQPLSIVKTNPITGSSRYFTESMRHKRWAMAGMDLENLDDDDDSDEGNDVSNLPKFAARDAVDIVEGVLDADRNIRMRHRDSTLSDANDSSIIAKKPTAITGQNVSSVSMDSSRRFIASHSHRAKEGAPHQAIARYALKQLRRNVTEDPKSLMQGVADMATETRVLSSLTDHPNIIKLRGIARGSEMPFRNDYFIILDRLYDTLESRMKKWKLMEKQWCGVQGLVRDPRQAKRKQLWLDRVSFAYDLSSALSYLHSNHVMHRDLKPANIGFDIRGDIKIFDFGLAKELPTVNNGHLDVFHFTGLCGSPRYMAPEVGMEEPYNELCDVYSFGVLFWEMMALSKPYDKCSMVDLVSDVWKNDADATRPSPSLVGKGRFLAGRAFQRLYKIKRNTAAPLVGSPASLQSLLKSCWSYQMKYRPSMQQVEYRLRDEILAFQDIHGLTDCRRMSHVRRRSTYIFVDGENDAS